MGNTLAAIAEGSMAPLFSFFFSFVLCACALSIRNGLGWYTTRTQDRLWLAFVFEKDDVRFALGRKDGNRRHSERNGTGNRLEFVRREVRERRGSRALPREESTRRFVRWLVSPRLATTPDLYPYMLSGVIDYRERSISKVQRSSCDSPSRLPSAFVTPDLCPRSRLLLLGRLPPRLYPLFIHQLLFTSESRFAVQRRGCSFERSN